MKGEISELRLIENISRGTGVIILMRVVRENVSFIIYRLLEILNRYIID